MSNNFSNKNNIFKNFRSGFPALETKAYMSICEKMILHNSVRKGVDTFLDHLALANANRFHYEKKILSSKLKFAKLMNVEPQTIAATRNVSDGINAVAHSFPWGESDNVVISLENEHPNNIYPWLSLGRRQGVQIRSVPSNPDGSINEDAMIEAIDGNTKILSCASVTYAPGHRLDITKIGEACLKKEVLFLVDGVQTAGILHHDLNSECVGGFATSSSKGLLGLYGFGFLYISPKWIDRLHPTYLSRPGVLMETDDHSTMGGLEFTLQPDSRRFEVGTYNLAGSYAADAALDLLLAIGTEAIESYVLNLSTILNEGVSSLGLETLVPSKGPKQSNIVTFGAIDAGGHDFSSNEMITKISKNLLKDKVLHTLRRGMLRFGLHAYNNEDDVERAIKSIEGSLRGNKLP
ncbi:MAG: aminotransferase class V-fold PLP-dependent enzyme [Sphingomonadales bacterium]